MTYTYKCKHCQHLFEAKQSIHDDALEDCPECEEEGSLTRVIQPAGGFRIGGIGVHKPTSTFYW